MSITKLNSKGETVISVQGSLSKLGYPIIADGHFGKKTQDAVKEFQKKRD